MGNGMIREIDLHDSLNTRINKIETTETNVANVTSQLSNLESNLQDATAIIPTVAYGMNNVIKNDGKVSVSPKFAMQGKTVINLLGKDGNCEDVSKWLFLNCTSNLDATNKVFGNNSIKITISSTNSLLYKSISSLNMDVTKYYFISAYLKNGNATSVSIKKDNYGGGNITQATVTDTSKFNRVGIIVSPTDFGTTNQILVPVLGTSGQYAYVDGIMINEITSAEYVLGVDALLAKYPYVDSYACLQNPYIEVKHDNLVRNGNGEEGVAWWTNNAGDMAKIEVINGKFRVTSTNGTVWYYQNISVKPNTNYYVAGNVVTDGTATAVLSITPTDFSVTISTSGNIFNSGANSKLMVLMEVFATGYAYFDSIMLVEGTTAPTTYLPCRIEKTVVEGKFTSDDSFTYENGEVSGLLNWKHRILYGKDYDCQFNADFNGFKCLLLNGINSLPLNSEKVVKYDGKILTHFDVNLGSAGWTNSDLSTSAVGALGISASDTDTGWAESIAPNADEVKAFMNGWKAITTINSGTRYLAWLSIVDGSAPSGSINTTIIGAGTVNAFTVNSLNGFAVGDVLCVNKADGSWATCTITGFGSNYIVTDVTMTVNGGRIMKVDYNGTTNLINWCKNNIAPGYEGYQLHYKLANPEPITDDNVQVSGDIPVLDVGDNYLYLDSGMVLGEVAKYYQDATYSNINNDNQNGITSTKYKTEIMYAIYKNNNYDNKWTISDLVSSNGKCRAYAFNTDVNTSATYTVDYKILATQAPQIGSIACSYAQDIVSAIEDLKEEVGSRQAHDSVLDTLVDLSMCETYDSTGGGQDYLLCLYTNNMVFIEFTIPMLPKRTIPVVTIEKMNLIIGGGANGGADVTSKFTPNGIFIYNNVLKVTFRSSDATIKANSAYGLYGGIKVIADCRGRI